MKTNLEKKLNVITYLFLGIILFILTITIYTFVSYHQIYNHHGIKHTKILKKIKVPKFISGEHTIYIGSKYKTFRLFDTLKTINIIKNDSLVINLKEYDSLHTTNSYKENDDKNYLTYISSSLSIKDLKKFKIEANFILNEFVKTYGKDFNLYKYNTNDEIFYNYIWVKTPNLIKIEIRISKVNFNKLIFYNNIGFYANIDLEFSVNNEKNYFGKEMTEIENYELLNAISD